MHNSAILNAKVLAVVFTSIYLELLNVLVAGLTYIPVLLTKYSNSRLKKPVKYRSSAKTVYEVSYFH